MNSRVGAACLALLLITGCSSEPLEKDASYSDVMELRDAYVASRAVEDPDCEDEPTQEVHGASPWEATTCGPDTVLLLTHNEGLLDTMTDKDAEFLTAGQGILLGPNWSIRGPQTNIEQLHDVLGGEIVQASAR